MIELIHFAFLPVNTGFTILLIVMTFYWLMVIIGLLDINLFDIDLDSGLEADSDLDIDLDVDGEADINGEIASGGIMRSVLHFFYVGEVPVMVLFSIFILTIWVCVIMGNYYFNNNASLLIALPVYFVSLIASLFVAKLFAMPLRRLYMVYNKDYNAAKEVVGGLCYVITTEVSANKMGQAEVKTKGAPIILNVIAQGDNILKKGDEAVVLERDKTRGIYYIAPANLEV